MSAENRFDPKDKLEFDPKDDVEVPLPGQHREAKDWVRPRDHDKSKTLISLDAIAAAQQQQEPRGQAVKDFFAGVADFALGSAIFAFIFWGVERIL